MVFAADSMNSENVAVTWEGKSGAGFSLMPLLFGRGYMFKRSGERGAVYWLTKVWART